MSVPACWPCSIEHKPSFLLDLLWSVGPWLSRSRRHEALELLVVSPPPVALCPLIILQSQLKFNCCWNLTDSSLAVSSYVLLLSLEKLPKMLHIDLRNLPISHRVKLGSLWAFRPLHSLISIYLPTFIAAACPGLITIPLTIIPASLLQRPASVPSKLAHQSHSLASSLFFFLNTYYDSSFLFPRLPRLLAIKSLCFHFPYTHGTDSYLSLCFFLFFQRGGEFKFTFLHSVSLGPNT